MERMDSRIARLRDFLVADPSNLDLACELADAQLHAGLSDNARTTLQSLPEPLRSAPGVRFRLARVALAQGAYGEAEATCRDLIDSGHDVLALWHDLAFAQLCRRQPEAAGDTVRRAGERFGADVALSVLEGRIALMLDDHDGAIAALDQAVSLAPGDATAQGVRALALFDGGRLAEAADAAQQTLQLEPTQHEALLVAATLALWQQEADAAQVLFERALQTHPNSGRALLGHGQVLMLRNELPRARATLEHAAAVMPDHIGTWHALAWAQLLLGDIDAAESSYHSAYALDDNFGDSHGGLALIAVLRGDHAAAEQEIKRALRLDPQAVTARYARTLLLDERGDHAGAAQLMQDLLAGGNATSVPVAEFAQRLKARLRGSEARS